MPRAPKPDCGSPPGVTDAVRERVRAYDWRQVEADLDARGYARLPGLLTGGECRSLLALYPLRERFRSFIEMGPRRFGEGDYRYFAYPLPRLVAALRSELYRRLQSVANTWQEQLGVEERFPASLSRYLATCHAAEQRRPTPLLLHYEAEGFNCLHQDLYGKYAFPLQVACLLSRPRSGSARGDFEGGEFLLAEQRPRQQSRAEAISLGRGEGLVLPTRYRPIAGQRGFYRAQMRHGVSRIHSGERFTLGIIFHDAQ